MRAAIYAASLEGDLVCNAENEDHIWLDPRAPGATPLAPLTRDTVLPLALSLNGAAQAL